MKVLTQPITGYSNDNLKLVLKQQWIIVDGHDVLGFY